MTLEEVHFVSNLMAQMKNQYEGYHHFWWVKQNEVVSLYCGSLFW